MQNLPSMLLIQSNSTSEAQIETFLNEYTRNDLAYEFIYNIILSIKLKLQPE